jgi:hypothetical protein
MYRRSFVRWWAAIGTRDMEEGCLTTSSRWRYIVTEMYHRRWIEEALHHPLIIPVLRYFSMRGMLSQGSTARAATYWYLMNELYEQIYSLVNSSLLVEIEIFQMIDARAASPSNQHGDREDTSQTRNSVIWLAHTVLKHSKRS